MQGRGLDKIGACLHVVRLVSLVLGDNIHDLYCYDSYFLIYCKFVIFFNLVLEVNTLNIIFINKYIKYYKKSKILNSKFIGLERIHHQV